MYSIRERSYKDDAQARFRTFDTHQEAWNFYNEARRWGNIIHIEEPMHMTYNGLGLSIEYWEVVVYTCV